MTKMNSYKTLLCAAALCALGACGDDEGGDDVGQPDARTPDASATFDASTGLDSAVPDAGDGGTSNPVPSSDPRYAVVTQLSVSGGTSTSYVSIVNSLASNTPLSMEGARQIAGRALAANEVGSGTLFASTGGAELTKFTLDASNKLVEAGKISFQPQGVQSIGEYASQLQFLSPTKAYYFDTRTAQVIVFNPTALSFTKVIPLPGLLVANTTLTFSSALPARKDGKLAFAAGWRAGMPPALSVVPRVALIVLDTTVDSANIIEFAGVTSFPCGYARDVVEGPDGRIYVATEAWGSAQNKVAPTTAPKPCLLRTDTAWTAFDASFTKDLNTLGGGVTGSLTKSRNGKVYTRVLDEAAAGDISATPARVLASQPAWAWAELTLGDNPTATKVPGAQLGGGSLVIFDLLDKRYASDVLNTTSNLIDISNGIVGQTATTAGLTFSIAQLR
jgi:hypothetical protein